MKLHVNDTIIVLLGDDAGKEGVISKVSPKEDTVLIDGINTYRKHVKSQGNQEGGVITISRPIKASKVALLCPHCKKPTRVGYEGKGKDKIRICKKCSKPLTAEVKKKK